MIFKTYSEAIGIKDFIERFNYLKITGYVGVETFGYNRYLNQALYTSEEWKRFRRKIIIRDNGCDLAHEDYKLLSSKIIIHHINPITQEQILNRDPAIFDPENVICCCHETHMSIHYGDINKDNYIIKDRTEFDTCPWKRLEQ